MNSDEITTLWVKLCKLCRVKTVITAELTVMSGLDPHMIRGMDEIGWESSGVTRWHGASGVTRTMMTGGVTHILLQVE